MEFKKMPIPLLPLLGVLGPSLLSLAPDLAKWLGGERAGEIADRAVQVAQAVTGTSDPVAAEAAIRNLTPEQRMELQVRLAEIASQAEREERQAELDKLKAELEDTADARKTMVELSKSNNSLAWMPAYKTITVDLMFFLSLFGLFVMVFMGVGDFPAGVREVLIMIFGVLVGEFRGSSQFWIGGSRAGSQAANAAVNRAVESLPVRPTQGEAQRIIDQSSRPTRRSLFS